MRKSISISDAVLGFAVADALGVPVEGWRREELKKTPVTSMQGYGTYDVPPGSWSDDTSMVVATMEALMEGLDYRRIMDAFCHWRMHGAYTPFGETFDCGITVNTALYRYRQEGLAPTECGADDGDSIGNGSLMRILPLVLYAQRKAMDLDAEMTLIAEGSALTHAHPRAILACKLYTVVLSCLRCHPGRRGVRRGLKRAARLFEHEAEIFHFRRILSGSLHRVPESEIESGGYVVHTLEAALWCVLTSKSYEQTVLKAVNLGRDTDTVAAVAGSIAGILYGQRGIPADWLATLLRREYLEDLCRRAEDAW